jgi:hypothetical protein
MDSSLTDSQLYQAAEEIESLQAAIDSITDSQLIRAAEEAEAQERELEELARLLREPSSAEASVATTATSMASNKFYELAKLLGGGATSSTSSSDETATTTDTTSTNTAAQFLKGWLRDVRAESQADTTTQDAAWPVANLPTYFDRLLNEPIQLQLPHQQRRRPNNSNNNTVISISSTEYSVLDGTPGPIVNRLVGKC